MRLYMWVSAISLKPIYDTTLAYLFVCLLNNLTLVNVELIIKYLTIKQIGFDRTSPSNKFIKIETFGGYFTWQKKVFYNHNFMKGWW